MAAGLWKAIMLQADSTAPNPLCQEALEFAVGMPHLPDHSLSPVALHCTAKRLGTSARLALPALSACWLLLLLL